MNSYVIATERFENLSFKPIGGHKDAIIANFFEQNSLNVSFWRVLFDCLSATQIIETENLVYTRHSL